MIGGKCTFVVGFIQSESIGNAHERGCGGLQQRCPTRRISGRPASFSKPKPQIKADQEGAAGRSYNYRVVMHTGGAELDMRGRCSAGQKVGRRALDRLSLQAAWRRRAAVASAQSWLALPAGCCHRAHCLAAALTPTPACPARLQFMHLVNTAGPLPAGAGLPDHPAGAGGDLLPQLRHPGAG